MRANETLKAIAIAPGFESSPVAPEADISASLPALGVMPASTIAPVLPAPVSSLAAETSTRQSVTTSAEVINCSSGFAATGSCGVSVDGYTANSFLATGGPNVGANLSGSQLNMIPSGSTHSAVGTIYQTAVNVQAFTATYTFVPNGWNIAFVIENNTNLSGNGGTSATSPFQIYLLLERM